MIEFVLLEFIKVNVVAKRQQCVPTPSTISGMVMSASTGEQVALGRVDVGVSVRVAVRLGPLVAVRVRVAVRAGVVETAITFVGVRVNVAVGQAGV